MHHWSTSYGAPPFPSCCRRTHARPLFSSDPANKLPLLLRLAPTTHQNPSVIFGDSDPLSSMTAAEDVHTSADQQPPQKPIFDYAETQTGSVPSFVRLLSNRRQRLNNILILKRRNERLIESINLAGSVAHSTVMIPDLESSRSHPQNPPWSENLAVASPSPSSKLVASIPKSDFINQQIRSKLDSVFRIRASPLCQSSTSAAIRRHPIKAVSDAINSSSPSHTVTLGDRQANHPSAISLAKLFFILAVEHQQQQWVFEIQPSRQAISLKGVTTAVNGSITDFLICKPMRSTPAGMGNNVTSEVPSSIRQAHPHHTRK
ncbi:hypothetical protein ACLOJK_028238 [Asimina triloba]